MNAITKLQALVSEIQSAQGEEAAGLRISHEAGTIGVPSAYIERVKEILADPFFKEWTCEVVFGTHCFTFQSVNTEELARVRMIEIAENLGFSALLKYLHAKVVTPEDDAEAVAQSILAGTIYGAEAAGQYHTIRETLNDPEFRKFIMQSLMGSATLKVAVKDVMDLFDTYVARFFSILPA